VLHRDGNYRKIIGNQWMAYLCLALLDLPLIWNEFCPKNVGISYLNKNIELIKQRLFRDIS
jgi:hypothetical protein